MDVKNFILGLAITILTIFVIIYGFNSFFPSPEYNDFCDSYFSRVDTLEECELFGGKWEEFPRGEIQDLEDDEREISGYCNVHYYCIKDYGEARENYSLKRFLILIPVSILVIIIGAVLFKLVSVGAGLMGGGVGTLIFGIGGYWSYASDLFRFLLSLLGLSVLIWFTYWFNNKIGKNKNKKIKIEKASKKIKGKLKKRKK